MNNTGIVIATVLFTGAAIAQPETYVVDPAHTYPSFEADHRGGMSIWRGKVKGSSGTIVLDRAARTGNVNITMDMATIDFGHEGLNSHAKAADILDVMKFPMAQYTGTVVFSGDVPSAVDGSLTLHGVTKPVMLNINSFLCRTNATSKEETCGADVAASFNRDDFGVDIGKAAGFRMAVKLAIQVEAAKRP
jgi:polyisoprenoid-binding protein YceI